MLMISDFIKNDEFELLFFIQACLKKTFSSSSNYIFVHEGCFNLSKQCRPWWNAAFHLGLHGLPKKKHLGVSSIQIVKKWICNKYQQLIEERSGRVLDWRLRGCGFEPHRRHFVVSLSKTLYPLLSAGSTQEEPSRHDWKIVAWYVKNQNRPKNPKQVMNSIPCLVLVQHRKTRPDMTEKLLTEIWRSKTKKKQPTNHELFSLLSVGSTQEDPSQHDRKIVDWDVKNQNKPKNPNNPWTLSLA